MKIVEQKIQFIWMTPDPLQTIEKAGRTCYKSEVLINEGSAIKFVQMLLFRGHEAMIEHASMSYRIICDRGVSHEIVRHRLFSFAQESTRYVNYAKAREIQVIQPPYLEGDWLADWSNTVRAAEGCYLQFIANGVSPQIARSVLPTCLKTELVVTGNLREWRHFLKLRTSKESHPQMQQVAKLLWADAKERIPVVFDTL